MIEKNFRSVTFNPFRHIATKLNIRETDSELKFDNQIAKVIAHDVLQWARSKGVRSFTFWIHPQTNETIQKHDSIYDLDYFFKGYLNFELVQRFTGMVLKKGEGDGSSFPNGGMRGTDKARAYIAWSAKSDMFIRQTSNGKVLYIPGMLLTHHGEALDQKTYLLRAEKQLRESTIKLMKQLGQPDVKHVMFANGIQQQFFIVRKKDFEARVDLKECGRTLYGQLPPRNQQFSDHYYGKIDDKILQILNQAEAQLLSVGVPVKTKHKQVAVNQYEIACSYQSASTALDHNMLLMDILKSTFDKHGYSILLHQKPFQHANGSGKHCNWSIMINKENGMKNLFDPGSDPQNNMIFVLFIVITLKAVLNNSALLKASVTSPSNEHRMGEHQAPPTIMSIFLGSYIDRLLNCIQKGEKFSCQVKDLQSAIPGLVNFFQDNTDRNRTSPFAFTGNKFEFRAVGSKTNVAFPMTVIAAIMTKQINIVVEELQKGTEPWDLIKRMIKQTKAIRFQGNGYSKQWHAQAAERGLPNLKTALESYKAIAEAEVLKQTNIFNAKQLKAKYNILMTTYADTQIVDAKTFQIIIKQNFLPRIINHLKDISSLGTNSSIYKKESPRFQLMYTNLLEAANSLNLFINQVESLSDDLEAKVTQATQLHQFIDLLSQQVSEMETELPSSKDSPQLFQMLNTYH